MQEAQGRVRQYTNTALVILYFDIGKIVKQKVTQGTWGQGTVQQLANYIQAEIPKLKSLLQKPQNEKVSPVATQLENDISSVTTQFVPPLVA